MLYKGSIVYVNDNSGAVSLKILNIKRNRARNATLSDIVFGVVRDFNPNKKLTVKDFVTAIVVTVCKKSSKGNGLFINFDSNFVIPLKITRFIKPLANRVYSVAFYELRYKKKLKVVVQSALCTY